MITLKKKFLPICYALLISLLLCSCAAGRNDKDMWEPISPGDDFGAAGDGNLIEKPGENPGMNSDISAAVPQDRKLIVTVTMALETLEFDDFTANLNAALTAAGGYTEKSTVNQYGSNSLRHGSYVLRVPSDKLKQFTEQVRGETKVLRYEESSDDVTLTYADIEGRLTALRAEQTALNAMLEKAGSISDCISLQDRLSDVRGEIESYESRLRALSSKISYSTVNISVNEVKKVTVDKEELSLWQRLANEFKDNASSVGNYLEGLFVGIVGGLPVFFAVIVTLLVIALPPAVLVCVIVLIVKAVKKKKAKKAAANKEK